MSIGYACLNIGTPDTNIRSIMQRNATSEKLMEVTAHNLAALEKIIDYNRKNNIQLFRISSDLIPFGSSPVNTLAWPEIHKEAFDRIGSKIRKSGMRVSLHPGQYTVLNSPTEDVVERAITDLVYHDKILIALGADQTNKIVLHVGGIYGIKKKLLSASNRISAAFRKLSEIGSSSRMTTGSTTSKRSSNWRTDSRSRPSTTTCTMPSTRRHQEAPTNTGLPKPKKLGKQRTATRKFITPSKRQANGRVPTSIRST